ncbi:hypothetical protein [Pareuzebyella sediminis]|uniref:hypothetical protein n=1 Tax=Pareuzebyella sediminis TaxID=2607998 RepID=UPI0011EFE22C|nr:hypothetical protein [Pareuzebyella sediminis]
MARKLYIFGIGGTGSRVLKALTMLFASGCSLENNFDTVIPIIIDPDTSNGDLNRTKDILRLYQAIRNQVQQPDDFFKQEIKTINELANNSEVVNPEYFQFKLEGVEQSTFGEYIGFDNLSNDYITAKDDKSFTKLLYSNRNLKSDLNVGFKGNPNMGSIVLNQFTNSENFKKFGQTFNDGDAIFIINSIFGGTGAAGFPLLLKNLRGNQKLPRHAKIKDSPIGGITYLPYFALNKQDEINSESFEEKAKIAIDYYNRTIISRNRINTLYFVGNKGNTKHLEYSVGGEEQKNDAHFLEMAGALAILDFCKNVDKISDNTVIKEFGIENATENITFNDLNLDNLKEIKGPLTKFKLYTEYLKKGLPKALNVSRWTKSNIKFVGKSKNSPLDKNYFNSSGYKIQIEAFNNHFNDWLNEMGENKPAFNPFQAITWDNALSLVKGNTPKGIKSFKAIDIENCQIIEKPGITPTIENKDHTPLIKLFGRTTTNLLEKRNIINS